MATVVHRSITDSPLFGPYYRDFSVEAARWFASFVLVVQVWVRKFFIANIRTDSVGMLFGVLDWVWIHV